ncbi:MAG: hypothetical protein KA519_10510 [Bacteroides sp.]|nr:hypothetical protein [Bacteroides sp.]MBP6068484.1 hypothetical protein [Bacteroides sp.]MBP6936172.1 hypothetical protein [Bacteroides sp.]MBP9506573.1 hypothetical protein [Bacteroides sp.]MBP9586298.1 hypothetical protein [Bacteroides sp.]
MKNLQKALTSLKSTVWDARGMVRPSDYQNTTLSHSCFKRLYYLSIN